MHGIDNQAIRSRHSQAFARRLKAAGVPARLVLGRGADHGLDNPSQQPTPDQVAKMFIDFFASSLARGSGL